MMAITKGEKSRLDLDDGLLPPTLVFDEGMKPQRSGGLGNGLYQSEVTGLLEAQLEKLINEAQEIVCLCSFLFSNKRIERALLNAAARGVRVYLMTAAEGMLKNLDEEELEFRKDMAIEHVALLNRLVGQVLVRSAEHLHAKFIIVDPKNRPKGFITTCNLTEEALKRNPELGIQLEPTTVQVLYRLFCWAFWENTEHELIEKGQLRSTQPLNRFELPDESDNLVFTASGAQSLKESVLELIETAKSRIVITSFGWGHPEVMEKLIEKARTGIDIAIIGRPRPVMFEHFEKFKEAGIRVRCLDWLHAKTILCDSERGLVTTANFQERGLDRGFEVGILLEGELLDLLESVLISWYEEAGSFHPSPRIAEIEGRVKIFYETETLEFGRIEVAKMRDDYRKSQQKSKGWTDEMNTVALHLYLYNERFNTGTGRPHIPLEMTIEDIQDLFGKTASALYMQVKGFSKFDDKRVGKAINVNDKSRPRVWDDLSETTPEELTDKVNTILAEFE